MLAEDRAGDAGIAVGVPAVEFVAVIQAHGDIEGLGWRRAPFRINS